MEFINGTVNKNIFKFFPLNIGLKLRKINIIMTYIIADPCVGTCDTACVEVCPVDCIHGPDDPEGSGEEAKASGYDATNKQLYINPEECIDCGACEPECPVDAIYDEDEVPDEYETSIDKNYSFFGQER